MEYIWHDGGRAACGYVGFAGDCVTRSIAIATGEAYRDVYKELSGMEDKTARHGISDSVIDQYLTGRGWKPTEGCEMGADRLPNGVVLVGFTAEEREKAGHMSCVINHTIYDTWNPFEDQDYRIATYWTCAKAATGTTLPTKAPGASSATDQQRLTQREYERILKRVQALHRTASNHASTEGEIRNALRAMQSLMLEHNLSRSDIVKDDDASGMGMTRRACPLNGRRACQWESSLASYLTRHIFPMVQYFQNRQGNRTFFWFYGPVNDVQHTLGLFREMLLTIATAARVKYGGHARGSGASYAEGYVKGLPRKDQVTPDEKPDTGQGALIQTRTLAIHSAADEWLDMECGIRVQMCRSYGRGHFDASAHRDGKRDGAKHEYSGPPSRKQITHYRDS